MTTADFKFSELTPMQLAIAVSILGVPKGNLEYPRQPDLTIAPNGKPYLYRWHIVRTPRACVYFHIQVADDPERPLHTHPWDNQSVILLGGYKEILHPYAGQPDPTRTHMHIRETGETITRRADWSHRLLLPRSGSKTMTLFSTGPKEKTWGFWYPDGFRPWDTVTRLSEDGKTSVHVPLADANQPYDPSGRFPPGMEAAG